jgi:hypothetical protein
MEFVSVFYSKTVYNYTRFPGSKITVIFVSEG